MFLFLYVFFHFLFIVYFVYDFIINIYRPEVREISGRSLLRYRSDQRLEPSRRGCTIVDNCINDMGQNRCKFDSTVLPV